MLKIKNHKILLSQSVKAVNQEYFLKELLEILLGRELHAQQDGECWTGNVVSSSFYTLRGPGNFILSLDFTELLSLNDNLQFYLRLVNLATALKKFQTDGRYAGFYFCENPAVNIDMEFQAYSLSDINGKAGRIIIARPLNFEIFSASAATNETRPVSGNSSPQGVMLQLGNIHVDLEDFMNLKQGMEIEFDLPESFQAQLGLGSEKLARVSATVSDSRVKLKVINIEGISASLNGSQL